MAREIEIEFKNMVSSCDFQRLLREFSISKDQFHSQKNAYFDTPNFHLKQARSALRIREKNGKCTLTLKQPAPEGLLEINEPIETAAAENILKTGSLPEGEVKEALASMDIPYQDIQHFGTLETERAEIHYEGGLLVFDHSTYLNCEDYEIEYEVKDYKIGELIFKSLLDTYQIPKRKSDNKVVRFYKEKQKLDLLNRNTN